MTFEDELREHGLTIAGDIDGDPTYERVRALYFLADEYDDPSVGIFGWKDEHTFYDVEALEAYWRANKAAILSEAHIGP